MSKATHCNRDDSEFRFRGFELEPSLNPIYLNTSCDVQKKVVLENHLVTRNMDTKTLRIFEALPEISDDLKAAALTRLDQIQYTPYSGQKICETQTCGQPVATCAKPEDRGVPGGHPLTHCYECAKKNISLLGQTMHQALRGGALRKHGILPRMY
jgi:hypothetical protein